MKPRPSLPQWAVAALIESTAQSHSGAGVPSLRKPNPFKEDLSPLSVPPRLIEKYNKEKALIQMNWLWIFYVQRWSNFGISLSHLSVCENIQTIQLVITIFHIRLTLNNMTSHNSYISYPPDMPSNTSRAKQYEGTGHKTQIHKCIASAWSVILVSRFHFHFFLCCVCCTQPLQTPRSLQLLILSYGDMLILLYSISHFCNHHKSRNYSVQANL